MLNKQQLKDRIDDIRWLCAEKVFPDLEAKLKVKAESKGEPIYEGLWEAKDHYKEMMDWIDSIMTELEEQS